MSLPPDFFHARRARQVSFCRYYSGSTTLLALVLVKIEFLSWLGAASLKVPKPHSRAANLGLGQIRGATSLKVPKLPFSSRKPGLGQIRDAASLKVPKPPFSSRKPGFGPDQGCLCDLVSGFWVIHAACI